MVVKVMVMVVVVVVVVVVMGATIDILSELQIVTSVQFRTLAMFWIYFIHGGCGALSVDVVIQQPTHSNFF